jgi:hypothetical protein
MLQLSIPAGAESPAHTLEITMKLFRWAAVAATALMSLMNLPVAFAADEQDIPIVIACAISVLGVLGFVAAGGLIRGVAWGRPAVLAVGAVNAVGAVIALITGGEGATIGLVVSAMILVFGFLADAGASRLPTSSPSLG